MENGNIFDDGRYAVIIHKEPCTLELVLPPLTADYRALESQWYG